MDDQKPSITELMRNAIMEADERNNKRKKSSSSDDEVRELEIGYQIKKRDRDDER